MKFRNLILIITFILISGCVGYSSTGVLGTGVSVAMDPRTIGTQIDDSLMQKNLRAKLILMDKGYLLNVKTKVLDGRIFITGKVNTVEEKLKITKLGWEIKGARSVKNDLKIKEEFNFNYNFYFNFRMCWLFINWSFGNWGFDCNGSKNNRNTN